MIERRIALEPYYGKRTTFRAIFDRFGECFDDDRGQTLLVQSLALDGGEEICSHTWIQQAENFLALDVRKGETVKFTAAVLSYKKRLPLVQEDGTSVVVEYGLYRPTGIQLIDRLPATPQPYQIDTPDPTPPPATRRKNLAIIQDIIVLADEVGGMHELRKIMAFLD
jgi:hypothetical protein